MCVISDVYSENCTQIQIVVPHIMVELSIPNEKLMAVKIGECLNIDRLGGMRTGCLSALSDVSCFAILFAPRLRGGQKA